MLNQTNCVSTQFEAVLAKLNLTDGNFNAAING